MRLDVFVSDGIHLYVISLNYLCVYHTPVHTHAHMKDLRKS